MRKIVYGAIQLAAILGVQACSGSTPTAVDQMTPVILEISVPSQVQMNAAVPIEMSLQNASNTVITQAFGGFPDQIQFDVVVTRPNGIEVWRRLYGQASSLRVTRRTLAPGETLRFSAVWPLRDNSDVPVPPGVYTVRGIVYAAPTDLVAEATLVIASP
jgi:hypothetical protein